MKFHKNKAKVILYYCIIYLIALIAVGFFAAMVFDENKTPYIIIAEISAIGLTLPLIKLFVAEIKQTVEVNENEIICENFIISGNVANGKIDYKFIESVTLKRTFLKPFSRYLFVKLKNDKPFTISDDYINYQELWNTFCNKCKVANFDTYIDEKIFKYIKR